MLAFCIIQKNVFIYGNKMLCRMKALCFGCSNYKLLKSFSILNSYYNSSQYSRHKLKNMIPILYIVYCLGLSCVFDCSTS